MKIRKLWDEAFNIFSKDAKYCETNAGNSPYYIRYKGQFICADETDTLMEKFYKYYIYHKE
jgi:hypothetical protein